MYRYENINNKNLFRFYVFSIVVLSIIYLFRFYQLQIKSFTKYEELAEVNAFKVVDLIPPRGDIFDREGNLIVTEQPAFSLYAIPALFDKETFHKLQKIIPLDSAEVWKKIGRIKHYKPIKIYRQLPDSALVYLLENKIFFKGIEVRVEPKRRYVSDLNMSHILGTLGEATEKEAKLFQVEEGDIIGKKGVERFYDKELRGEKGYKFVVVDAIGRIIKDNIPEKTVPPKPGEDLYLTIDYDLQKYGEELMQGKKGAIILIDVQNGEILTLVSAPGYDLNLFTGRIKPQEWQKLISDTTYPLYDRALQSLYPPGSTYKLVSALAALQEKIITTDWKRNCPGYFRLGRKIIKCWKKDGHGELDLLGAIENSCNVYFYQLGLKIGLDVWEKYSKLFRFGQLTGIDIYGEKRGLVPSNAYFNKIYGKNGWTKGNLANLAIGQGELLVTPLQMAQFAMIIANKGFFYRPHVRKYFYDKLERRKIFYPVKKYKIQGVDTEVYDFVREGMFKVVHEGTGRAANIKGFNVAGKTGTAQNPHGKSHAWFIGFAPYENPKLAFSVVVENGGSGGAVAAPIIRKLLRKYIRKYQPEVTSTYYDSN